MKPISPPAQLDAADRSPHRWAMSSGAPPKDKDEKKDREREAKLAQALRANLRRRKQAPPKPAAPKAADDSA